jgi:hypothetical protein
VKSDRYFGAMTFIGQLIFDLGFRSALSSSCRGHAPNPRLIIVGGHRTPAPDGAAFTNPQ